MTSVLVAGTIRVPPEKLDGLRPHVAAYVAACRAEDGCDVFSFADDLIEPGLIRIFEVWRDAAALEQHKAAPHVAAWRALWPEYGVHGRSLTKYEAVSADAF
jgi:quinol monooxygenase YgiN